MKNDIEFKQALEKIHDELSQLNNIEFEKILEEHQPGDFYNIILETQNLKVGEIKTGYFVDELMLSDNSSTIKLDDINIFDVKKNILEGRFKFNDFSSLLDLDIKWNDEWFNGLKSNNICVTLQTNQIFEYYMADLNNKVDYDIGKFLSYISGTNFADEELYSFKNEAVNIFLTTKGDFMNQSEKNNTFTVTEEEEYLWAA